MNEKQLLEALACFQIAMKNDFGIKCKENKFLNN